MNMMNVKCKKLFINDSTEVSYQYVQENISNARALTASHGDQFAMVYGNVQGAQKRCIAIIQHVPVCLDVKIQVYAYLWIIYVI